MFQAKNDARARVCVCVCEYTAPPGRRAAAPSGRTGTLAVIDAGFFPTTNAAAAAGFFPTTAAAEQRHRPLVHLFATVCS